MTDWDPIHAGIDYFLLEGQRSPGIARVAGHGPPRKWEERGGYGLSGSTLVYLGNGLAKWKTEIELWDAQDWAAWKLWRKLLPRPKPGAYANAQDFWHPFLEEHEIRSAVLLSSGFPKQVADGVWVIEHEWMQYRRPKLALQKPEGSAANAPADPVDELIGDLLGQVQELSR